MSVKPIFFLFLLFISTLFSGPIDSSKPVLLRKILMTKAGQNSEQTNEKKLDVDIQVPQIPGDKQRLEQLLSTKFIGRRITADLLMDMRSAIALYYQSQDVAAPKLVIPLQDFSSGRVHIQIVDFGCDEEEEEIVEKKCEEACDLPEDDDCLLPLARSPLIPILRTVVLVSCHEKVGSVANAKEYVGIMAEGLDLPCTLCDVQRKLEPLVINRAINEELLTLLKKEVVELYMDCHRPVVTVSIPEQDVTDGVLYLVVVEGRLGKVCCCGQRWFSCKRYEHLLGLKSGKVIRSDRLLNNLGWIQRNPFRAVDAYFTPGDAEGLTDIKLKIDDRFPIDVYAGGDNTGNDATGNSRFFAGFTWGNAFFLDHLLTFQYTTSADRERFRSFSGHYTAPLPWRHLLIFFGGYARFIPHIDEFKEKKGSSTQASARYVVPVGRNYGGMLQELSVGFDYKNTNNNLIYSGDEIIPIITRSVNLTQFMVGYAYGRDTRRHKQTVTLNVFGSPGPMISNESNKDFNTINPGAKNRYIYGRLTLAEVWRLPWRFSFSAQGRFQLSSNVLLQSEEFGLGGYDTVRGYEEREVNADNALCVNVELRSRPFRLFRFEKEELILLAFFDYGRGEVKDSDKQLSNLEGQFDKIPKWEYLMSFGPGLRYIIAPYLSFRVDWGIKVHRTFFDPSTSNRGKIHVGLLLNI